VIKGQGTKVILAVPDVPLTPPSPIQFCSFHLPSVANANREKRTLVDA